jgi:RHS repeat-associated protein
MSGIDAPPRVPPWRVCFPGSGNLVSYYSRGATLVKQRNASGSTLTQSYLHLDSQGTVVLRSKEDGTKAGGVLDPDPWGGDPGKRWGRVVVDSFTRADANALGTAETGQSWTESSSPSTPDKFGIRSGKARVIDQTVNYYFWAWCPSGQSDVRVKVRLTVGTVIGTPPGNGVGIFFRSDSAGNGLLFHYLGGATNNWRWSQGGSAIATVTGPVLTQGQTYDLEVRASGSNCTAFVDGVQIGGTQTITAHQTDTYHGLYVFQSTDHLFENFSVLAEADAEPVGWLGDPGYFTEAGVMRRLEYVRARWYQAGGPGWLSKDPIGLRGGDINLYRYVGNRPLVAIDPSGMARSPVPMRPPGDCSWAVHNALQDVVDAACSVPRACTKASPTDCNTILLYIDRNFTCATARRAINVKCYRGGDDTHRPMEEEAWTALAHCTQEYAYKCGGSRRRVPVTVPVTVPVPVPGSSPCVRHQPVSGGIPTGVVVVGAGILIVGGVALILLSGGAAAPAVAEVGAGALPFLTAAAAAAR